MTEEPEITVNGTRLTEAQAMTVRVALASFDTYRGDDEHGRAMSRAYADRLREVSRIMLSPR